MTWQMSEYLEIQGQRDELAEMVRLLLPWARKAVAEFNDGQGSKIGLRTLDMAAKLAEQFPGNPDPE